MKEKLESKLLRTHQETYTHTYTHIQKPESFINPKITQTNIQAHLHTR